MAYKKWAVYELERIPLLELLQLFMTITAFFGCQSGDEYGCYQPGL